VVAYANRSNNKKNVKYHLYEGECLTIFWVVSYFWCYLYGSPFTLVTDHWPLKFLMESNQVISKLARWAFILHEHDFDIGHRVGRVN
jgi:hypothetical protein